MKILVADDDPTLRSELAELLRADGHQVDAAADGGEALERLEAEPFEVALLDLVMPRATGLEVLHRLQVVRPETAVVMITGHGSVDVAVEAMKGGAVDFVVKPFEIESLQRVLQSIADERHAREMLNQPAQGPQAVHTILEDAARRKALLAVVGPGATAPRGASRILRIDEEAKPPNVFAPSQLYQLNAAIEEHVARTVTPVVYAAGLKPVEDLHGRADLEAWVRHVGGRCEARGGTLVVRDLPAEVLSDLESGLGVSRAEPGLQGMLESLANPIRRAIVSFVFSSGPVAYSAILKMNFVDSSSKLSFHLQKLQADSLLTKADGGSYLLTEEGRQAWRVVRALGDERRRPAILFDSR
ncbi:MAG TPA: response regulator [Thermoplasmata archaeon]|nr:response regulator [Thermoplasmata archaeon]